MLYWLDLFGVFVFAISGALAADRRGMDLFGFVAIALLPAIGGGTVRDIVLGAPVFWVQDTIYLWLIGAAALLTFLAAPVLQRVERLLLWADAVGLSVFCVAGAAKSFALTGSAEVAVVLGVVTAVLGGIIRDVVCNEIPLILRQDIYATAAFTRCADVRDQPVDGDRCGARVVGRRRGLLRDPCIRSALGLVVTETQSAAG